jgi:hypothetical protein
MADNSNRVLPVTLGTTATAIVSGPAANKSRRVWLKLINISTAVRTAKISQHTGATAVTDATLISPKDVPIPVADQLVLGDAAGDTPIILRNGDSLSGLADAASGVTVYVAYIDSDDQA